MTKPEGAATPPGSAPTALVVDDDPMVAATLVEMLKRVGMIPRHVASGTAALALLETERFDAVLLDVRLPDMSGAEVYARLERQHPEQAARVVFVTGGLWRAGSGGMREPLPSRPSLAKPCTLAQLREALEELGPRRATD